MQVLVCVHCAGKLCLVEIATEAAAIKRIIRDERSGRRLGSVRPELGKAVFEQRKRSLKRCRELPELQPLTAMAGNRPNAGSVKTIACRRVARIRGLYVLSAAYR